MKRLFLAVAVLALAGCQTEQHYTIEAPPQPQQPGPPQPVPQQPPPLAGTAGPLTKAGVERYMDGQETDLRARLRGKGVMVARRADVLLITIPNDKLFVRLVVSSSGRDLLEEVASVLAHYDHTVIEVSAYTDTSGSPESNLAVSQKRARLVSDALAQAGVAPARIAATGMGEANLKVRTGDNVAEPRNRRIEIRITPKPA